MENFKEWLDVISNIIVLLTAAVFVIMKIYVIICELVYDMHKKINEKKKLEKRVIELETELNSIKSSNSDDEVFEYIEPESLYMEYKKKKSKKCKK